MKNKEEILNQIELIENRVKALKKENAVMTTWWIKEFNIKLINCYNSEINILSWVLEE